MCGESFLRSSHPIPPQNFSTCTTLDDETESLSWQKGSKPSRKSGNKFADPWICSWIPPFFADPRPWRGGLVAPGSYFAHSAWGRHVWNWGSNACLLAWLVLV